MRAPAAMAESLAHTTSSVTRPIPAEVSKPQSVQAITRLGSPTARATLTGLAYDPSYGCTLGGDDYGFPTVLYGRHPDHRSFDHGSDPAWGGVREIGRGFYHGPGRGMGGIGRAVGADRGFSAAHYGGGGFAHGMGVAHAGGFGGFHGGGF